MNWTAILLTMIAMTITAVWCAAIASTFNVPRGELASWAQALGSLVAVGAAIWSANFQARETRRIDQERRELDIVEARERARRLLKAAAERLHMRNAMLKSFAEENVLTGGQLQYLADDIAAVRRILDAIDKSDLDETMAGVLVVLEVLADTTPAVLRTAAEAGKSVNSLIIQAAKDDLSTLDEMIEHLEIKNRTAD